jgi:drug/metabolite transporter (DMT)-like permease
MHTRNLARYDQLWPGVPAALLAAGLFGASTPFAKLLLGTVDPWLLAGMFYLSAGIGLAAVRFLRRVLRAPIVGLQLRRADLPLLAAITLSGAIVGPVLFMYGLAHTSAANGSLLLNLEGIATLGIAWLVLGENVDRRLFAGALAIVAGAALLSWQGEFAVDLGALLIAGACLAWAIDNNISRQVSEADPTAIAMIKGLAAGTVNIAIALFGGAELPDTRILLGAGVVGFLGYGVSLSLFIYALRHIGTARTSAYFSSAPFVGAVLAVAFLGEPVTGALLAAGALMGVGLWLHIAEQHDHEHRHEALMHEHLHEHDDHHKHDHPVDEEKAPHVHAHEHSPLLHKHPHYPDAHHRHGRARGTNTRSRTTEMMDF